jgi:hypothetical protein
MNDSIRQTQKKYGSMALIAAISAAMVFILLGEKAVAKGIVLGTIFSVLNFVLLGEILPMITGNARKKSTFLSLGSIGVRFGLLSIPLILSIRMPAFNFAAAVIGIFMVQILIFADLAVGHFFAGRVKRI